MRNTLYKLISEKGNRTSNDDRVIVKELSSTRKLIIVADGMGGYDYGGLTAELAIKALIEYFSNPLLKNISEAVVIDAITAANKSIGDYRAKVLYDQKIGTTIAMVLLDSGDAFCGWVGDCRICFFKNGKLIFQSKDHTLVNSWRDQNRKVEYKIASRFQHIVTRSLQGDLTKGEPDVVILKDVCPNDLFLICSDGVTSCIAPSALEYGLKAPPSLEELSKKILIQCKNNAKDNYSFVLIHDSPKPATSCVEISNRESLS